MTLSAFEATSEQLVEAMQIAIRMGGAPLETAGNVLAAAYVTAAATHPEWAASYVSQASPEIRALAEAIVNGTQVTVRAAFA